MFDLKAMRLALEQLETERKIPREKIIDAIEQSLAAAYKKEYGKKGQIVRCIFDLDTGSTEFNQVKIVVDESMVHMIPEGEEFIPVEGDEKVRYNEEHHILLNEARRIKSDAQLSDEIVFPLEDKSDFGRIAAQTAKQVIIQKIREAERGAVLEEFGSHEGEVVNGIIQKYENGIVLVEFNRATGIIPKEEQIPGETYNRGDRIRAYLFAVEDGMRGVNLRLSRSHPQFIKALFRLEAPEIESGVVEIKSVAREAGSRSKIAVMSNDEHVDPTGACVGQRGTRVTAVMNELNGEKIDIIEWSDDPRELVANAIAPAQTIDIQILEDEHRAVVEVAGDQLSLAIGKGGQNVRLAAKLTGWRIDIKSQDADSRTETKNNTPEEFTIDSEGLKAAIDDATEDQNETQPEVVEQNEEVSEEKSEE